MKARFFFVFLCLLGAASLNAAEETLGHASAPLAAGVPKVAIERLRTFLRQNPSPAEALSAQRILGQALFIAGRPAEALETLQAPSLTNDIGAVFWRAQSLSALGRWSEAWPLYQQVAGDPSSPYQSEAAFGEAQALRELGRKGQALKTLALIENDPAFRTRARLTEAEILLEQKDFARASQVLHEGKPEKASDRNERRFLLGRLSLLEGRPARAVEILAVLLKRPSDVSHRLLVASLFAQADAHLILKTPEDGDDALEEFIDHHPSDSALPEIFAKLDQLYRAERKPSTNELERWTRDPAEPRRAFAQWYLARSALRSGNRERALALLQPLQSSPLELPSLGQALLELAHLHLERSEWDAAISAAEAARQKNSAPEFVQRADWLIALAHYRAGQLAQAAPIFETIAEGKSDGSGNALFNAAVCWLQLGREQDFAADYRKISDDPTKQNVQGDLLLEQGAIEAAKGKPEAQQTFEKFIHDFPQSPRVAEAWVALAELAFHASKPDLQTARDDLGRARASHPSAAAVARADYLQIWIDDAAGGPDESNVIRSATNYLQHFPDSPRAPEVRMKLAEAYYERQDFANAQTQFELLAEQKPEAPLAEKALFFAARAAKSSMATGALDHALALLDQVVKLNGDLKWAARNEEAAIERRLGRQKEALALYEEVLKNDAKPAEHREALCGKGDVYYEMGANDPENYRRALAAYDQLASEPGLPPHWRNQALFKKGKALEQLHQPTAALDTYYGIIEEGSRPDQQHEFFWFYKAGFNAAQLLEESSDWKSAVAVYRKLVAVGGARSDEAKARLTQLRLEHFLWEQ